MMMNNFLRDFRIGVVLHILKGPHVRGKPIIS